MPEREDIEAKQKYLFDALKRAGVEFAYNDYDCSVLEAVLARAGRSVADALYLAYKDGARFDAWGEYYSYEHYRKAFEQCSIDVEQIVGAKTTDEVLPWDFVDIGVTKDYLKSEYVKALNETATPSCNKQCNGCGLNKYGYCKDTHGNIKKIRS